MKSEVLRKKNVLNIIFHAIILPAGVLMLLGIFTGVLRSLLRVQYLCNQLAVSEGEIYDNKIFTDLNYYLNQNEENNKEQFNKVDNNKEQFNKAENNKVNNKNIDDTNVDNNKADNGNVDNNLLDYVWIYVTCNYENEKKSVDNYLGEKLLQLGTKSSIVDKIILKYYVKMNRKELYTACGKYVDIKKEMLFFPVATFENDSHEIVYSNTWNAPRTYGGVREHKGCDIMDVDNTEGYFPVVSVGNGTVEKMGWLELGGYRIGIRSDNGIYYYYAHLNSYAQGLKEGDKVKGGQLIGFMGSTGYGKEGTSGKFDCHLHFGIYVDEKEEVAVNPYYFLRALYSDRLEYAK